MRRILGLLCVAVCVTTGTLLVRGSAADAVANRAHKMHFSSIVLDTHDDTTQRFFSKSFDLGKRNPDGHIDIPRMREGGMNAIFFSIWIDGRILGAPAVQKALDQIDAVHENVRKFSNDMVFARTAEDVRRAHAQGKIAALMGVEGGHMIGNDIRMVRIFGDLGVRYMTLSHFYNDEWADSSTDKPAHNGLTDYGKDIVREMNRQGIMVDISHVSDKTFYDALEVSKAPLIASHSSCRALCNHVRDMSDDMIDVIHDPFPTYMRQLPFLRHFPLNRALGFGDTVHVVTALLDRLAEHTHDARAGRRLVVGILVRLIDEALLVIDLDDPALGG